MVQLLSWAILVLSIVGATTATTSSNTAKQSITTANKSPAKYSTTAKSSTAKTSSTIKPLSTAKSSSTLKSLSTANSTAKSMTKSTAKSVLTTTHTTSPTGSCPPYKPTLRTKYNYTEAYTGTSTYTFTDTIYASTVTLTYNDTVDFGSVEYTSTTTVTYSTSTAVVAVPAKTTVTIPTPPGFTPIACEPTYVDPTTTLVSTLTTLSTDYAVVSTTVDGTTPIYIVGSTVTTTINAKYDYTVTVSPTVTITRTDPTSTVYAACASNNIVSKFPLSEGYGEYIFFDSTVANAAFTFDLVPSLDVVDCCGICQANSSCVGSAYHNKTDISFPPPQCQLLLKGPNQNQTCDPTFQGPQASSFFKPIMQVSNGACGEIVFGPY